MNMKLIVGFAVLVVTCSPLGADTSAAGAPDPKDMKGMTPMAPPPVSDGGYYVSAYGGAQWSTSYGNNRQTITPSTGFFGTNQTTTTIHSNWGGVGGVKFGYAFDSEPLCDWMSLRLQPAVEADALYIGDNSHATSFAGPGSQEKFSTNSGDFFINGVLRLKNSSIVTPYFGAGAGLQYITTHGTLWGPGNRMVSGVDTSDLDFAAQALGGFDFRLCDHVSLFTEYKFIDALGTDGHSTNLPASNTYRFKPDQIQQHLITAGVTYAF
jgi:opacity protein-like surface antigen